MGRHASAASELVRARHKFTILFFLLLLDFFFSLFFLLRDALVYVG